LPHASEGAGPEHSSGKLERWLQLVCDDPDAEPGTSPFSMKQIATGIIIYCDAHQTSTQACKHAFETMPLYLIGLIISLLFLSLHHHRCEKPFVLPITTTVVRYPVRRRASSWQRRCMYQKTARWLND